MHTFISHQSFDWSCRNSKASLVRNLEEIVKDIGSLKQVDTGPSSPLFKAAIMIYDLTRKKKNGNLGKERFVERVMR